MTMEQVEGATDSERMLLVLDIDETLVFANEQGVAGVVPDAVVGPYKVHKRPFVDEFIAAMDQQFRLALWTSGSGFWARAIEKMLFAQTAPLDFVWSSNRCTISRDPIYGHRVSLKDFRKLRRRGYDLRRVLVIDNTAQKHHRNWGNLIHVKDFEGQQDDIELRLLMDYIPQIASQPNVRKIDKRTWRTDVRRP